MFVDVHAHLCSKEFSNKLDGVIERCKDVVVINNGLGFNTNLKVLEISKKYDNVESALGIHPLNVFKEDLEKNLDLILKNKNKIVALGEIGLDFLGKEKEKQIGVFNKMIGVAEKLSKVVIVHSRKAEKEVVDVLESSNLKKIIMHYFTGSLELAKRVRDNKWLFSIPGVVLINKNMQELVREVEIGNLLSETDSPFLSVNGGNEPLFVLDVVKKIAEIKKMDVDEVEDSIYNNYKKLF